MPDAQSAPRVDLGGERKGPKGWKRSAGIVELIGGDRAERGATVE